MASTHADPNCAGLAGLTYVSDHEPGIRRRRDHDSFRYFYPDGTAVRDSRTQARIKSIVIPPAWTDVWISPIADGHIQATGRDARGRKQYRYHPAWRAMRDRTKYEHSIDFGLALPRIRARVDADLRRHGLPKEKVVALVVSLLDQSLIRVGNSEYARENESFGLTTLRRRHAKVNGQTLRFEFRGKAGKWHSITIHNRRLARVVRQCQEIKGHELFQYIDSNGQRQRIDSSDVNEYLREVTGRDFTAKDFRTWSGTVLLTDVLSHEEPPQSDAQAKRELVDAIKQVAGQLGNTAAVCRACYVHPAVIELHLDGRLGCELKRGHGVRKGLDARESAVLRLLQRARHGERKVAQATKQLRRPSVVRRANHEWRYQVPANVLSPGYQRVMPER